MHVKPEEQSRETYSDESGALGLWSTEVSKAAVIVPDVL